MIDNLRAQGMTLVVVALFAAAGFLAACWVAAGWAERAADWLRARWRDHVTPPLEDDEPDWIAGWWEGDERVEPLPTERTWEQMTSHQLPLSPLCAACGSPYCPGLAAVDFCPLWQEAEARRDRGEYLITHPLGARRERRAPWWEAEQRQAYAALDLEYPSGLMARVREAAQ